MARTRGDARRERQAGKRAASPPRPQTSECDSTVRQWGLPTPPPRRQRRFRSTSAGEGVPWSDMPENALYKVFETLLQDKDGPHAFRAAAACCRGWRLASMEVLLDDTAASRPELPPLVIPEVEDRKPALTTATTCNAGMCDEAESEAEVNGFEASSREQAKRRGAGGGGDRRAAGRHAGRAGGSGGARRGAAAAAGATAAPAVAAPAPDAAPTGAAAAGVAVAQPAAAAGGSAHAAPGPMQRRHGGFPPLALQLRNALDDPIFRMDASPESAEAAPTPGMAAFAAALVQQQQQYRQQQQEEQQQQQQPEAAAAAAAALGAGPSGSGGVAGPRRRAPVASPSSFDTAHAHQPHAGPVLRSERRRSQPAPDASGGSPPAPAQRGAAAARRGPRAGRQQQQQQQQQHSEDGAGVSGETPSARPGAQSRRRRPQHPAEEEEEEQQQPNPQQQPEQAQPRAPRARSGAKRQRTGDAAPAWGDGHAVPPAAAAPPPQPQQAAGSSGGLKGLLANISAACFKRSRG
ncbi:hypothetical protein Rsub_11746 [Raphidocelis subcapitata]|uniref:Uncharacterized protein n=1 Tax=Raphidocelis subcapitata TaxID=307507 RepID=A0A2V0PHP0_9CHLO|nr:hypothetical protein Rsub_11746 [Raphidocelis subcapitata]|eukprot:GBF99334.1 hypothetical protein Rsub_11746 [Raphidocelis subcapitata]